MTTGKVSHLRTPQRLNVTLKEQGRSMLGGYDESEQEDAGNTMKQDP